MISRKPTKTIIHFREKIIDYKILVRYTTDFLMNLFVLSQKKYNGENIKDEKVKKSIAKVQAQLLAEVTEYSKTLNLQKDNMVEVKLKLNNNTPIIRSYSSLRDNGVLLMVTFQKIDWDEINIFRKFLFRYITHYLKKKTKKTSDEIKQIVTNLSFVIQEFLQNANLYGIGDYGYELVISYVDDKIIISVENYTDSKNAAQLQSIVNEINNAGNIRDLILKYMLNSQKHLGLISSVFNNYLCNLSCKISRDNLVRLKAVIETDFKKN